MAPPFSICRSLSSARTAPRFLITGATGQLGVELARMLRELHGDESVLCTDVKLSKTMLDLGPFAYLDVTDPDGVRRLADEHKATHIVHLASLLSAVGERNPGLALKVGNQGIHNVLEAARHSETARTVFAPSSIAVFGANAGKHVTQDSPTLPYTMYGVTKVHVELMGQYYRRAFGVDFRSIRYPGVVSATPGGGGTTDWSMDMLMHARSLLAGGPDEPYKCFLAEDAALPYVEIEDCLKGTIQFIDGPKPNLPTYNLGALSFTPAELADSIRRHAPNLRVEYDPCPTRSIIASTWPATIDDSAARSDWGWAPKIDTIDKMVDEILFPGSVSGYEDVAVAVGELPRATAGAPTGVRRYSSSARHSSSSASGAQAAAPVKLPHLEAMLEEAKGNGTFKRERTITTPQGAHVHVAEADDDVLVMCANNYLGLANHPRIKEAAVSAIATHGVGMASVRFICGTSDLHTQLERRIADFHHTDDCILYPSCFDANAGLFETILGPEDAVISDTLNHASIIDGVRLCKAKRFRYANCDMADLEAKLVEARDARVRLIATDGVFSMDSTMAPLKEIVRLARKHDALVMVDECHATGVIGATGRGTLEVEGVLGEVDIVTSTLGKAMGGASGGFTAGRQQVVDVLRQKSRPYLFSNTVAPPIVAAASAAFDILEEEGEALLGRIRRNAETFRARLTEAGFELKPGNHPIIPVMLHDAQKASDFAVELQKRGVYAVAFSYPVVPKGQARIRTQMSAAHTPEDIEFAADTFIAAGKAVGAIP